MPPARSFRYSQITTESNNPYVGDSSASKYGYGKVIFETLGLVNQTGDRGVTPWLAESIEWNDDYTVLTVVPRKDVTWSDGEPFTADDIVYSYELVSTPALDTAGLKFQSAEIDGDAVVLTFGAVAVALALAVATRLGAEFIPSLDEGDLAFLGQFALAEGKQGGQYYTPKSIVTLIVEMLQPYNGRVYDPAMGSGGFFVSSDRFIEEHAGEKQYNAAEQKQFADDFCNCLKAHGFAKLINHGLDDESVKQLYHWVSLTPSPLYTQHCGILVNVYRHLPSCFHHMLFTSCVS